MGKIRIAEIAGTATSTKDDTVSVGMVDPEGNVHTAILEPKARGQLLMALLANIPRDPNGFPLWFLQVGGLSRFQLGEAMGVHLMLQPGIGVPVVLHRKLAAHLVELIQTFDDPSTWTGPPPKH